MLSEIEKRIRQYEVRLGVLEEKLSDATTSRKKRPEIEEEARELRKRVAEIEEQIQTFEEKFLDDFPDPKSLKPEPQLAELAVERVPAGINFLMIGFLLGLGLLIYWLVSNTQ